LIRWSKSSRKVNQAVWPDIKIVEANNNEALIVNPSSLDKPTYLMNLPFSLAADVANNVWMDEISANERKIDIPRAVNQFLQLYHFMAADAVVYLLPTPRLTGLQDLVFTANIGIVLEHLEEKNVAIISNFTTRVRRPETKVGKEFFELMGYQVYTSPHHFEGEAELKYLHDNIYIGGYGVRSQRKAYEWMSDKFDMHIIPVQETDPYLYHLDCTVFPLTYEETLLCTEMYTKKEIRAIEAVTNIIDVSLDDALSGICNSVRIGNTIMNASNIHEMKVSDEYYQSEQHKNRLLEDIAVKYGFEVSFFNLSEYFKSGALLSCMVMHLNRQSYQLSLT
jgi:N-dimethylarginine dimethylaminohydrolase